MTPELYALAADAVLIFHVAVALFNVFGLIAIPLGAWLDWPFVRVYWWRLTHVILMATVALQAYLGRACFLTYWQAALDERGGGTASTLPLIQGWIMSVLFWPLPVWVFGVLYSAAFAFCFALWWLVPPVRKSRGLSA